MKAILELVEHLSAPSQEVVSALVKQLCENEGMIVPTEAAPGLQTLEEGIPLWEAWMVSQYSPGSARLYTHYVRRLLVEDPAPTSLSIQQRQAAQLIRGISPTAVKSELKALKSFFGYLWDQALWLDNPVKNMKPPRVPHREVKAPKPEEVRKLLSVVDKPKLSVMLALFLDTGIRFGELAGLLWERVNFDYREITVIGKGDKERTIPISPLVCTILEQMKNDHAMPDERVFLSQSIEGWDNRDANRSLARLCRKAGIKKYTCHQFRHAFATFTLEGGGEGILKSVSEMLGHTDASMTAKFYLHTDKRKIRKAHDEHGPFAQLLLPEGREVDAKVAGERESRTKPRQRSGKRREK